MVILSTAWCYEVSVVVVVVVVYMYIIILTVSVLSQPTAQMMYSNKLLLTCTHEIYRYISLIQRVCSMGGAFYFIIGTSVIM